MTRANKCIWCNQDLEKESCVASLYICTCPNCGKYKIAIDAFDDIPQQFSRKKLNGKRHLFSGYIREMNDLGLSVETVTNSNFENILSSPLIPKTTMEKLDKLLLSIYRKTDYVYQEVETEEKMFSIGYAKNEEEFSNMFLALENLEFLRLPSESTTECALTLHGIQHAESLLKEAVNSKQCFVAMRFSPDMMDIFHTFITPAVQAAGYGKPLIISNKEHNDKICDQIIAEIRNSKFLIADFTGHRGGVYFEAGFALGLGLPVIWTCQKNDLDNAHFDVNHYNFIVWETGEELRERLTNRILATII